MDIDSFMTWLADTTEGGQRQLASVLRGLTYQAAPEIFDVLDEADGQVFLEPLLFAYFSARQPKITLPQIILGYVDSALYPEEMEVQTDAAGTVYLPRIGYYCTEACNTTLILRWDSEPGRAVLLDGDRAIAFRFEAVPQIPGTNIEIGRYGSPLLVDLAIESRPQIGSFRLVDERAYGWAEHLGRAMAILSAEWPEYYRLLTAVVRQVVLFQSDSLNSFATASAHGIAFLNVAAHDDEVFFIEDLLHQCGHVIFNAATARRRDYIAVDPEAKIGSFNNHLHDERSVYVVLHGAFTEFAMTYGMRKCDERAVFAGRQAHELVGRLAFIAQKFGVDLNNLAPAELLTPAGRALYEVFFATFERLRCERPELITGYTMKGQPYNFSYELFARANPML